MLVNQKKVLLVCLLMHTCLCKTPETSVITAMSNSIGEAVIECQGEMEFDNSVIRDFMGFWKEKNDLRSADLGCALVCVFDKLEVVTRDGLAVRKDNFKTFLTAMNADEETALRLVELFELCKKSTDSITDMCEEALQSAKCFRYGILRLHWEPTNYRGPHSVDGGPHDEELPVRRSLLDRLMDIIRGIR